MNRAPPPFHNIRSRWSASGSKRYVSSLVDLASKKVAFWLNSSPPFTAQNLLGPSLRSSLAWMQHVLPYLKDGPLLELIPGPQAMSEIRSIVTPWNYQTLVANFLALDLLRLEPQPDLVEMMKKAAACGPDSKELSAMEPILRLGTLHLLWGDDAYQPDPETDGLLGLVHLAPAAMDLKQLETRYYLVKGWRVNWGCRPELHEIRIFKNVLASPEYLSSRPITLEHDFSEDESFWYLTPKVLSNSYAKGSAEMLLIVATGMAWANQIGRFHQTVAMGLWALGEKLFWTRCPGLRRRLGLDLWIALAEAMAQCWMNPEAVYVCKSRSLAYIRLPSCLSDICLSELRATACWGLQAASLDLFKTAAKDICTPKCSTTFEWVMHAYFSMELRALEDLLFRVVRETFFHSACSEEHSRSCRSLLDALRGQKEEAVKNFRDRLEMLKDLLEKRGALVLRLFELALDAFEVMWDQVTISDAGKVFREKGQDVKYNLHDLYLEADDVHVSVRSHWPRMEISLACFELIEELVRGGILTSSGVDPVLDFLTRSDVVDALEEVSSLTLQKYSVAAAEIYCTSFLLLAPFPQCLMLTRHYLEKAIEHYSHATRGRHARIGLLIAVSEAFNSSNVEVGRHRAPEANNFGDLFHPNRRVGLSSAGLKSFFACVTDNFRIPPKNSCTRRASDQELAEADLRLVGLIEKMDASAPIWARFGFESLGKKRAI